MVNVLSPLASRRSPSPADASGSSLREFPGPDKGRGFARRNPVGAGHFSPEKLLPTANLFDLAAQPLELFPQPLDALVAL